MSAKSFWSNFLKKSSQLIGRNDFSPEYPGKSSRIIPVSARFPVPFTAAGCAPRASAHSRISSWSVVVLDRCFDPLLEDLDFEDRPFDWTSFVMELRPFE